MKSVLAAMVLGMATAATGAPVLTAPVNDEYWAAGRAAIASRTALPKRPRRAKNVILLIGDGMGIATITAGRIFDGQNPGAGKPRRSGEENSLSFETLPHLALVKTYNSNAQVPDSAGTASAMNTGIKTRIGTINMGQAQTAVDCASPAKWPRTIAEIAKDSGMAVGVVTTTRVTHATPAAVYGHVPSRNWEGADRAFPVADRGAGCPDLARQLVDFKPGGGLDLVLGGGRARFVPTAAGGLRDDGADLTAAWQARFPAGRYVADAKAFRALKPQASGPVLGLFTDDHLSFEADRDAAREPSLTEMAQFAVARMAAASKADGNKGYYLMIEGGRIDHAHHATNPYRALSETQQFSRAIAAVLAMVDLDETLVLVTADHSHVMTMAGYPERGNDILGYIRNAAAGESRGDVSKEGWALDDRGQPMTTLSYTNGAFETPGLSRRLPPNDPNYLANKLHGTDNESHGGEDVALFADGPGADLVGGVIEQNVIFHIVAEALGWR